VNNLHIITLYKLDQHNKLSCELRSSCRVASKRDESSGIWAILSSFCSRIDWVLLFC